MSEEKRLREIEAGEPLTEEEKKRYQRVNNRIGAKMKIEPSERVFHSACKVASKARFEAKGQKYRALKARMKAGEMIPREDFLFVKSFDAGINHRRNKGNRKYTKGRTMLRGGSCSGRR